jgi:hypothetical protein
MRAPIPKPEPWPTPVELSGGHKPHEPKQGLHLLALKQAPECPQGMARVLEKEWVPEKEWVQAPKNPEHHG